MDNVLEDAHMFEAYFADGEVGEDDNGLIWKDILREGEWAYRPGAGQRPVSVPLKVLAGHATEVGEIGMADLIESFEDGAVDHVTVPTSHDDRPHENTGYIRKLTIVDRGGKKVLRAGIDFTEPDIKGKVTRGTIANCSSGIIFDYVKKDNGKKYNQVLGHVALTNKPWINGMKPFGVAASENFSDDEIVSIMLENVVWDEKKSFNWTREKVAKAINKDGELNYYVFDVMPNKALVGRYNASEQNEETYVVNFRYSGDEIKVPDKDKWTKASREWVEASLSQEKDFKNFTGDPSLAEEAPNRGANVGDPEQGGKNMGSENDKENEDTSGAPSDNPAPKATVLSEEARTALRDELKTELSEEFSKDKVKLAEEKDALAAEVRELRVDKRVTELSDNGFDKFPGLLAEMRNIMLADKGANVITLSETVNDEETEVSLSATGIVERIINALPKDEATGSIKLGEELLQVNAGETPPAKPEDTNLSDEEKADKLAEELGRDDLVKNKDGDA